jgi:hypothetical protein
MDGNVCDRQDAKDAMNVDVNDRQDAKGAKNGNDRETDLRRVNS